MISSNNLEIDKNLNNIQYNKSDNELDFTDSKSTSNDGMINQWKQENG